MKRILVGLSLAFSLVVPSTCLAHSPTRAHVIQYQRDYRAVQKKFGHRAPGCNLVKGYCHSPATDSKVVQSTLVLERMLAPPPPPAPITSAASAAPVSSTYIAPAGGVVSPTVPLSTTSYSSAGGLANVPGVPSSFASCVAFRESTDGKLSSNIYGIQGGGGSGSIAEQKAAFSQMYANQGINPWHPYDGCG